MRKLNACGLFVLFGPSAEGVPLGSSSWTEASGGRFVVVRNASQRPSCSFFSLATSAASGLFAAISASVSLRSCGENAVACQGSPCDPPCGFAWTVILSAARIAFASTF